MVAWIILWIMSTRPNCRGTISASTLPQLETKTWPELAKWHKRAINSHWFTWVGSRNNLKFYHKQSPEEWFCSGQSSREENAEAFAGQHAATSTSFYVMDEASGIPDAIRETASGGLTDGEPMFFAFGNPTRNTGWFYEACFGKMRRRYSVRCIDSRSCKMTNKALIKEWEEDYGEDSDYFRVRARGLPPRQADCQFIGADAVYGAVARRVEMDAGAPLIVSVDVARFGSNKSIILTRQGFDTTEYPIQKYSGLDTMQLSDRIARHIDTVKPDATFIDDAGVGGGVVDRLNQLGYRVNGINAGSKASDAVRYANLRAEMWDQMREWLTKGSIPNDQTLIDGLIAPEYAFNSQNKLKIESKEDMARRGIESPDEADALAQSFANRVRRKDMGEARQRYAHSEYEEI
ncbi:MAG: terminase [Mariprofundaceae bacterium]